MKGQQKFVSWAEDARKKEAGAVAPIFQEGFFLTVHLFLATFQRTDQKQLLSRDKLLLKQNCNEKVPLLCNVRTEKIPTRCLSDTWCLLWNVRPVSFCLSLHFSIQPRAYRVSKDTFTFPTIYEISISLF